MARENRQTRTVRTRTEAAMCSGRELIDCRDASVLVSIAPGHCLSWDIVCVSIQFVVSSIDHQVHCTVWHTFDCSRIVSSRERQHTKCEYTDRIGNY